jgi:hypothetical protein
VVSSYVKLLFTYPYVTHEDVVDNQSYYILFFRQKFLSNGLNEILSTKPIKLSCVHDLGTILYSEGKEIPILPGKFCLEVDWVHSNFKYWHSLISCDHWSFKFLK